MFIKERSKTIMVKSTFFVDFVPLSKNAKQTQRLCARHVFDGHSKCGKYFVAYIGRQLGDVLGVRV